MEPETLRSDRSPTPANGSPDPQRFLDSAEDLLSSSLDSEATLAAVSRLAVSSFASFCLVDLLTDDRTRLRRVLAAHRDPALEALAESMCRFPPELDGPSAVPRVIRTGRTALLRFSPEDLRRLARSARHAGVAMRLDVASSLVVALTARGRTLGAISFSRDRSMPPFVPSDIPFAEAVAARAGLALEHARLSASERGAQERVARAAGRAQRHLQATAALSGAATSAEVNQVLVSALLDATGADAAWIALRSAVTRDLVVRSAVGLGSGPLAEWRRIPLDGATPTSHAVVAGEPVYASSYAELARTFPAHAEDARASGFPALVSLPLSVGGTVLGAAGFAFREERIFDQDERDFLATLAHEGAQALARAGLYDAAQAANVAKANFLGAISHELRTPLTAVAGYADLLAAETRGPLTEGQRDQLHRLQRATTQIVGLVDQILDFARVDAGADRIEAEPFDLVGVGREALETVAPAAQQKGLLLSARLPPSLEIVSDRGKGRQILVNLLGNAVKFTDRGGVELHMTANGRNVRCEVRDTGVGIAPEHVERIFDRFWQVDQSETRRIGGTGLGLSLARQLARALGGDVEVRSEPGRGSVFTLLLPYVPPAAEKCR